MPPSRDRSWRRPSRSFSQSPCQAPRRTGQRGLCPSARRWRKCDAREKRSERQRLQDRSEEHTSELQSLMRISYAVFCLKKKKHMYHKKQTTQATKDTTI